MDKDEAIHHSVKNIDLESLKNILCISSQGTQNTFHINICDQQNIVTVNNIQPQEKKQTKKTGDEAANLVSPYPHLRRDMKTSNLPPLLNRNIENNRETQYLHLPNSVSSTGLTVRDQNCLDLKKIDKLPTADHRGSLSEEELKICPNSHSKFLKDEKRLNPSLGPIFTNDLSDGATEISKTYMLRAVSPSKIRRSVMKPISITKSINQLPSLVKQKSLAGSCISKTFDPSSKSTEGVIMNLQNDEKNITKKQSTKQFRRLSLSIGSLRGSRKNLPTSTFPIVSSAPANEKKSEEIQCKSPVAMTEKSETRVLDQLKKESTQISPCRQGKVKRSKTFKQWISEKDKERKEMAEKQNLQKEKEEKKICSKERNNIINSEVYNEWLKKKHRIELEEESRRTMEMRNKWAAKGVYFVPETLKLRRKAPS